MGITVLHVITGLRSGGAERMLTRLLLADSDPSKRQIVVSLLDQGVYGKQLRKAGIELHCLTMSTFLRLPGAFLRLITVMRKERPDFVMTWLYHADCLGTLAAVASGIGTRRVVWNLRCSNLELANYAWTTRLLVRLLPWLSPLPAAVATNSQSGRQVHETLGYRPRRWVLLPNGLDLDEFRPSKKDRTEVRAEHRLPETVPVVGMIARVDPQKDHATFLAAAKLVTARHPEARFVLVGHGTQALEVSSNVHTLGERRDVPRLMRALDIAVVSSGYGEGFPNALLEAMATGLSCVVTDVGDAAAISGGTGIVVAPRSPEQLAEAINTLILEEPRKRAPRGRRARDLVRQNYSLQTTMDHYDRLWGSLGRDELNPLEQVG